MVQKIFLHHFWSVQSFPNTRSKNRNNTLQMFKKLFLLLCAIFYYVLPGCKYMVFDTVCPLFAPPCTKHDCHHFAVLKTWLLTLYAPFWTHVTLPWQSVQTRFRVISRLTDPPPPPSVQLTCTFTANRDHTKNNQTGEASWLKWRREGLLVKGSWR